MTLCVASPRQQVTLNVSARSLLSWLTVTVALLLVADLAGLYSRYALGHGRLLGFVTLFDLWEEGNIPTLFSTLLLLFNAVLFFIVWDLERRAAKQSGAWRLLAFVFCFLGIDEFAQVHEKIGAVLAVWKFTGPFYFAWIIPYLVATFALGCALLPMLLRLEPRIRWWMLLAGAVYVAGAAGFEALEGMRRTATGVDRDLGMDLLVAVEETLEMVGQVILIHPLLSIIAAHRARYVVTLDEGTETMQ